MRIRPPVSLLASALVVMLAAAPGTLLANGYDLSKARLQPPPPADSIDRANPSRMAKGVSSGLTNGDFETNGGVGTNVFSGWTVVDQAGGNGSWLVQTGTTAPSSGNTVNPPAGGAFAAMTDQGGPGSHVMYQDITIPADGATILFDLFIQNQGGDFAVPAPASLDFNVDPNQQFRVDLMDPAASDFDVDTGVLQNLYQTLPGDATVSGYDRIVLGIPGTGVIRTVRLRFAEVDNQGFFNVGVDNVQVIVAPQIVPGPNVFWLGGLALLAGLAGIGAALRRS